MHPYLKLIYAYSNVPEPDKMHQEWVLFTEEKDLLESFSLMHLSVGLLIYKDQGETLDF